MLPNFQGMDFRQLSMMNNPIPPQNLIEENINYYQEACKLYIANVVLTTQMKELVSEKNELLQKITKLEKKVNENQSISSQNYDDKKKRHRRVATEIDRHYRCPIEICQKSYGSEGSLTQHLKLKHPDYFSKIGLNQLYNLKEFEDFKSMTSEDRVENDDNKQKINTVLSENKLLDSLDEKKLELALERPKEDILFSKEKEVMAKEKVEERQNEEENLKE